MRCSENRRRSRGDAPPLQRVVTEPDILVVARHKTESVKSEILSDFTRIRAGRSELSSGDIRQFERRWLRGCRDVENRVFAVGLSEEARAFMEQIQPILAEIFELVQDCAAALERDIEDDPVRS